MAGQFRAERCEVSGSRHGDDGWLRNGSFEADDHAFRIDRVEVDTTFDKQPTEPVATFVDGPTSTTAVEKDNGVWLLPGGTGLVCLLAGAWNIRSAVKRPREALVAAPA
ncbi:hypothetical protein ACWKT5_20050 [Streptomyces avermitilis]